MRNIGENGESSDQDGKCRNPFDSGRKMGEHGRKMGECDEIPIFHSSRTPISPEI